MRLSRTSRRILAALGLLVAVSAEAEAAGPLPHVPAPLPAPTVKAPPAVRAVPRVHVAPVRPAPAPKTHAGPVLWTERETPIPDHLLPQHGLGPLLGKGSFKKVYVAKGDPDAVVRVMQPEEDGKINVFGEWIDAGAFLGKEHQLLRKLEQHGFPVVRVLAKGEVSGLPADVLERFELSDRDKDRFARDGSAILRTAVPDLRRIRRALETSGLAILDIQVLMKKGHVVIADPMDVIPRAENPGAYAGNLKFIDDLLALAGEKP